MKLSRIHATLFLLVSLSQGCILNREKSNEKKNIYPLIFAILSSSVSTQNYPILADTADTVNSAPNHNGSGNRDKTLSINGIRGSGSDSGSTDVFSLSQTGTGASITLEWAGKKILNGTGIDFIVFENPFRIGGQSSTVFFEPIIVEVSQDNSLFCGFDPDYTYVPETSYSNNPTYWKNFAGKSPVLYNEESNRLTGDSIYDTSLSGGDGFDLENLSTSATDSLWNTGCTASIVNTIKTSGFIYLRLTAATSRTNPNTGSYFVKDTGAYDGPDIDGVFARYRSDR